MSSAATDNSQAIADKLLDVRNGTVAVYDPVANALKAVPKGRAQHFIDMGYHVGMDAQNAVLRHSTEAKVGAFLTAGGNAGSAGLLNMGLAATGQKGILKSAAQAQADNPGAALAGSATGIIASAAAGPLRFGGLTKGALAAAAERGGLANVLAKGANVALQGAPAMAVQGAADAAAHAAVLDHPVTAEQLAASAFTDVVWNAGFNALTHGIVRAPSALRSGTGNLLDRAEQWGLLKKKMVEETAEAATGPRVSASTKIYEREYRTGEQGRPTGQSATYNPEKQLGFDAGPNGSVVPEPTVEPAFDEPASAEHGIGEEAGSAPSPSGGPEAPPEAAKVTDQALGQVTHSVPTAAGLPPEVAAQMAEPLPQPDFGPKPGEGIGSAKAPFRVEPELEPVPEVESLSYKKAKLTAAEKQAEADRLTALKPEDVDLGFEWGPGYTKRDQLHVIREWIKEGAAEAHPDALSTWDIVQNLENEIQAVKKTKGYPNKDGVLTAKYKEKALWKKELTEMFPRQIDHEAGVFKPGFEDLNAEYARAANPDAHLRDLERPGFVDKNQRQYEMAQAEHAKAQEVADKADAHVSMLEQHHSELDARSAVVERNRVAKADAAAKEQAAAREAKIADKEQRRVEAAAKREQDAAAKAKSQAEKKAASEQAKAETKAAREEAAKARKSAAAEEKAARDKGRAEAKAARDAERATAKSERDAAREAAKKARETQRRLDAQSRAHAKAANQANMPRSGAQGPKSVKTEQYTIDSEGPEGIRRDTVSRKTSGDRVKERHKVTIKAPKEPPKMKFAGYEKPFSGDTISKVVAGGFYTGTSHVTNMAAGAMGVANFAASLASHRQAIGNAFIRLTTGLNKLAVPVLAVGSRVARQKAKEQYSPRTYDVKDYAHVAKTVSYLAANPEAVVSHLAQQYPSLAAEKPDLHHGVTLALMRAIMALHNQIPKKPYDPTLKDTPFTPTRAQQIKTLRTWTLLSNPNLGVDLADPDNMRLLQEAYPEMTKQNQEHLTAVIQDDRIPVTGALARQMSTYLGANVRPMDDAAARKRLQQTAGPEPMQKPHAGGIGSAAPSSKITTQAAQRDMPTDGLFQLGA